MLEITTAVMFLVSSMYGTPNVAIAKDLQNNNIQGAKIISGPATFEDHVREYFAEDPILAEIARCESTFRQIDSKGNTLRGIVNKGDVGVMQINEYYHADTAKKLGLDLKTVDGNLAYAKYLYDKEGVTPWNSSSKCWKPALKEIKANNQVALAK